MRYLHKRKTNILVPIIIALVLFIVVFLPVFCYNEISEASNSSDPANPAVAYTVDNDDYNPDPNYATKEYWNKHYKAVKRYIDNLTSGQVLESGDYFIDHDITVNASDSGCPGIIINGSVNIYFEKADEWSDAPKLTIYGGNASLLSPSYPAIELTKEDSTSNRLYFQGCGELNLYGGSKIDDNFDEAKNLMIGGSGNTSSIWNDVGSDEYSLTTGDGGFGGNGTAGAAAAIGTIGGKAGSGMTATKGLNGNYKERDGNSAGRDGQLMNGKTAPDFGNLRVSGNIKFNCVGGSVYTPDTAIPRSIGGKKLYNSYCQRIGGFHVYECFVGFSNGGGNGGFGFKGAAIGVGGSGGSGGGAGGTGAVNTESTWFFECMFNWFGVGGAGGAGTGSIPSLGGGVGEISWDKGYDYDPDHGGDFNPNNPPADQDDWCQGSEGSYETGAYTDEPDGGDGGQGGISETSVNNGTFYSACDVAVSENNDSNFLKSRSGAETNVNKVYPKDEVSIRLVDSIYDDGNIYKYTGSAIHPKFEIVHTPTGKVLNDVKKNLKVLYNNITYPGKEIIDPCSAQVIIQNDEMSVGAGENIFDTIDGGSVEFVLDYEVVAVNCFVEQSPITSKTYDGGPIQIDKSKLKIMDENGNDITEIIDKDNISYSYYTDDSQRVKLDRAPKDAGKYILDIKINDVGYVGYASKSFEIYRNSDVLISPAKTVESIYGDDYVNLEDIELNFNCVTFDIPRWTYGLDYWLEYTFDTSEVLNVGDYEDAIRIYYTTNGPVSKNYAPSKGYDSAWYYVDKRSAKITVQNAEKIYTMQDPQFSAVYSDFLRKETPTVEDYTLFRESGEDVDTYNITGILTESGKSKYSNNYDVSFVNGKFTINKAICELKVYPLKNEFAYGDDAEQFPIEGYAESRGSQKDLGLKIPLTRKEDYDLFEDIIYEEKIVQIWFECNLSGTVSKNIDFGTIWDRSYVKANLIPRNTDVTIGNVEKIFGDEDPNLEECSFSISNPAIFDDEPEVLKYGEDYTLERTKGENVGEYQIQVNKKNNHYAFNNIYGGKFTINPKDVYAQGKVYYISTFELIPDLSTIDPHLLCDVYGLIGDDVDKFEWNKLSFEYVGTPVSGQQGFYAISIDYSGDMPSSNYKWAGVKNVAILYIYKAEAKHVYIKYATESMDDEGNFWLPEKNYDADVYSINKDNFKFYENPDFSGDDIPLDEDMINLQLYEWENSTSKWTTISEEPSNAGRYMLELSIKSIDEDSNAVFYYGYKNWYFNINKVDATISAINQEITYGQNKPTFTVDVVGMQGGQHLTENDYTVSGVDDVNAGIYDINVSVNQDSEFNKNYNFTCVSGKYTIKRKSAMVTLKDEDSQPFKQVYGESQKTITASTNDMVYDQTLEADDYQIVIAYNEPYSKVHKSVGIYNIYFEIIDSLYKKNYIFTLDPNTPKYSIVKRDATVTAENKNVEYGNDEVKLTIETDILAGDISSSDYTIGVDYKGQTKQYKDVDTYDINVNVFGEIINKNYSLAITKGKYEITRKRIDTVTVNNVTTTYGEDAEFSYTLSPDLVADDELVEYQDYTYDWDESVSTGDHDVSMSFEEHGPISKNYSFVKIFKGTYHVDPKPVTLKPKDVSYVYGDDEPDLTVEPFDLAYDEEWNKGREYSLEVVSIPQKANRGAGTYTIKVTYDTDLTSNYSVTTVDGTCIVKQRKCVYDINTETKVYGQPDPDFAVSEIYGLLEEDEGKITISDFTVYRPDDGEDADMSYPLFATIDETEYTKNYSFTPSKGSYLTITKAPLTISVNEISEEVVYGDPLPKFTAEIDGLQWEDQLYENTDYIFVPSSLDAGKHTCNIKLVKYTKPTVRNYDVALIGTDYTIKRKDIDSITINNVQTVYGQQPTFSFTLSEPLLSTEILQEGSDYNYSWDKDVNFGEHTISMDLNIDGPIAKNYNFRNIIDGTYFIEKADLEVNPVPGLTFTYGEDLSNFPVTINGLKWDDKFIRGLDYYVKIDQSQEVGFYSCQAVPLEYEHPTSRNYNVSYGSAEYIIDKFRDMEHVIVDEIEDQKYTGEEIRPKVSVSYVFKKPPSLYNLFGIIDSLEYVKTFDEGIDYVVKYEDNIEPGTATVMIEGIDNCEGSTQANFQIVENSNDVTFDSATGVMIFIAILLGLCVLASVAVFVIKKQ